MAEAQYPILELITLNIVETLEGVTKGNGYNVNLKVFRPDRLGDPVADNVCVVMLGDTHLINDQDVGLIEWEQEYLMLLYVVQPEGSTTPYDQLIAITRADIEKALQVDPYRGTTTQTQDSSEAVLAQDTRTLAPVWFHKATGTHEGIIVRVMVRYRTMLTDPYVVR